MPNIFHFDKSKPISFTGGTLQRAFKKQFHELSGISIQSVRIPNPGDCQSPHFHPNASQLDYCISGKAQVGIIDQDGQAHFLEMNPGDLSFVPQGNMHWFKNIGDGPLHYLVVFTNEEPVHIDATDIVRGIPKDVLSKALRIPQEALRGIPDQP